MYLVGIAPAFIESNVFFPEDLIYDARVGVKFYGHIVEKRTGIFMVLCQSLDITPNLLPFI